MKWLCFGAGAIGTYIGGSLALAGESVVFVERPPAASELQRRGLRLDLREAKTRTAKGVMALSPDTVHVHERLDEALGDGPFDAAIYALKSFDLASAAEEMRTQRDRLPPILCLSNGVDNEAGLAEVVGTRNVIAGTVTTAIGRRGAGDIVLERLRGVGIASTHALSRAIVAASGRAGLNPRPYGNAAAMKWSKMLTNLIANPTSAILDMTAAEVLSDPRIYDMEMRMLRECLAVMRARRIALVDLPRTPVRALGVAASLPTWLSRPFIARAAGAGRGGKMPSFHIDLHSGRGRSEVEHLHGAVVRAGKEAGVPTPVNAFLTETLLAMTRGDIGTNEFARQPAKLARAMERRDRAA